MALQTRAYKNCKKKNFTFLYFVIFVNKIKGYHFDNNKNIPHVL